MFRLFKDSINKIKNILSKEKAIYADIILINEEGQFLTLLRRNSDKESVKGSPETRGEDDNDNRFVNTPLDEVRKLAVTQVGIPQQRVAEQEVIRRAYKIAKKPISSLSHAFDILDKNK